MIDQNYDRWKSAAPPENDNVSCCCGDSYTDSVDEEGYEILVCDHCDSEFYETISQQEYNERKKDDWEEMRSDEERLERDRDE